MICPRCTSDKIDVMANSPIEGVWIIYQCQYCLYTWRNTEPVRRTEREHYPAEFRMTQQDINNASETPIIPLLIVKSPLKGAS